MEYVIANKNGGSEAYWYERSIPTLEEAKSKTYLYPLPLYILEYKYDRMSNGVLPTGRTWKVES